MKKQHKSPKFNIYIVVLVGIVLLSGFLRFWQLEHRMQFSWDQIQNAWVMKDMLVDGKLPLIGMVAKGNSGFYIGPGYYYLLAPFYWLFRMDPIGAGVFVGVISLLTLLALVWVTWNMFSREAAIAAALIYTVSVRVTNFDRIPWPVNFIPILSIFIFYFLYKVATGQSKYLLWLAAVSGFAFHFHFTALYFPVIILAALPLYVLNRGFLKYALLALPLFLVWFIPNAVSEAQTKFSSEHNLVSYTQTYYHGLHLRRVLQLVGDAFIEFEYVLVIPALKWLKYLLLPFFVFLYARGNPKRQTMVVMYLTGLWFVVPLLIMSVYAGEISDYYFSISRPIVAMILGYMTVWIFQKRNIIASIILILYWGYFAYDNLNRFAASGHPTLPKARERVQEAIRISKHIEYGDGNPDAYLQFMYEFQQKKHK